MKIDIPTLILLVGISHLMQILVFSIQYKSNKNIAGPGWWLLWCAAESLGFILILFRSHSSLLPFIIILQDPIILSGAIFIYIGIRKFFDKKINIKLIFLITSCFLILHLFFYLVKDNIYIRSVLIHAFLAGIAFLTATNIYKNRTRGINSSAIFNSVLFLIHGIIFTYITITISFVGSLGDAFIPLFFNYLQYFDALIIALLWTFGFIMMLNQRLNAETNEAKTHFEQIFNLSPNAILISHLSNGVLVDCNESFSKILGFNKDDIKDKSTLDIHIWKNPSDRVVLVNSLNRDGYCDDHEILLQHKNGRIITGLMSAKLITIKGMPHILSVVRDITEQKAIEEEIKQKNLELQKLNSEKDKFFSIIAHDLKSPFNAIVGFSNLLIEKAKEKDCDSIEDYAHIILKSSEKVMDLLSNLMEWSRSQTGRMNFNPKEIDFVNLINDNLELFNTIAKQKSITITSKIPTSLKIQADESMINTILRNLISNALKFTYSEGKITLSAEKRKTEIIVSVSDTGVGIPQSTIEKLFRIDENVSTIGTQKEVGTGLGLILCKEFVEMHGGKIWVESEPGKNSTFSFTLKGPDTIDFNAM
ncbi:MAG: PAS domain-containing sensor histidine kinase [Bacteroidetes bacterium]|nr:PAS domain-containing sensor histidine kinase [Bacteroidota bacterium]